jgi:site-specific recombinase XerD
MKVERLPPAHIEREYLRLHEIPLYLSSCSELLRPLAELLIGSGLRISEALALRIGDLEIEDTGGMIVVYRSRKRGDAIGSTKSDRFRSVEIGPALAKSLAEQVARRAEMSANDQGRAHLFVMPVRVAKGDRGRWQSGGAGQPFDRTTVSRDWHKHALQDAALRDMPLHALRHTAAAAWLAAGNSLMYVQRQLGHADIRTTERYYGHLERNVLAAGAIATEEAIAKARSAGLKQALLGRRRCRRHQRCTSSLRQIACPPPRRRRSDGQLLVLLVATVGRPGVQPARASSIQRVRSSGTNRSGPSSPPIGSKGCGPSSLPRRPRSARRRDGGQLHSASAGRSAHSGGRTRSLHAASSASGTPTAVHGCLSA